MAKKGHIPRGNFGKPVAIAAHKVKTKKGEKINYVPIYKGVPLYAKKPGKRYPRSDTPKALRGRDASTEG